MSAALERAAPMPEAIVREQLLARRAHAGAGENVARVDAALARLDAGAWGICRECEDPIETDRLLADPLLEVCLDHLSAAERRALEDDLALAARVQSRLQPPPHVVQGDWEIAMHAEPARIVGGDYLDLVPDDQGGFVALLGDVSGHGVAASMLAAHLHATFRSLVPLGFPLTALVAQANRLLVASTLPSQYATLAAVHVRASGELEVANAGHPPLLLRRPGRGIERVAATGVPLGLFADARIGTTLLLRLHPGDALVLYSDGFTEARDGSGQELGEERLAALLATGSADPRALLGRALGALRSFRAEARDDASMLVLARRASD